MTYTAPLVGGVLIGLAASLFLLVLGRVAGVSGIFARLLNRRRDGADVAFVVGLVAAGAMFAAVNGAAIGPPIMTRWSTVLAAGLLVGFGTCLGNGCTSGHGVCGIGSGSRRSFVATLVFMATAALTVFFIRHVLEVTP